MSSKEQPPKLFTFYKAKCDDCTKYEIFIIQREDVLWGFEINDDYIELINDNLKYYKEGYLKDKNSKYFCERTPVKPIKLKENVKTIIFDVIFQNHEESKWIY